uniref:uncharacterized protein LOC109953678 n=1 Tax=Monopterus albus TaxID=43700 RepID=UPI0009B32DA2
MVVAVHQTLWMYSARPPPLCLADAAVLSARNKERPSSSTAASGMLSSNQVSVIIATQLSFLRETIRSRISSILLVTVLEYLSSRQKAELLLEPNSLSNETLVRLVFTQLNLSSLEDLGSFFDQFVTGAKEQNLTTIDPRVRGTILNLTLSALSPKMSMFDAEAFKLWFQVYLPLILPGIDSSTFESIPRNISCVSYQAIVKGCDRVFTQLSVGQTQQVFKFIMDYFGKHYSSGRSCVEAGNDDRQWLQDNFGKFYVLASYKDFVTLKNNFNG